MARDGNTRFVVIQRDDEGYTGTHAVYAYHVDAVAAARKLTQQDKEDGFSYEVEAVPYYRTGDEEKFDWLDSIGKENQ